jgi:hypothetical protein
MVLIVNIKQKKCLIILFHYFIKEGQLISSQTVKNVIICCNLKNEF